MNNKTIEQFPNIGFSTGAIRKHHNTKSALNLFRESGFKTAEVSFGIREGRAGWLDEISEEDLAGFHHVSMHAPKFTYKSDDATRALFARIEHFNRMRKLDVVVFHPDMIEDFNIFRKVQFKVGIENMDNRKERYQRPEELQEILSEHPDIGFILDVNHIYTNDPSMALADGFYDILGDRIVEVQLSGYKTLHDPLFETKQEEIIRAIRDPKGPMIVEAGGIRPDDLVKEIEYIASILHNVV